MTMHWSDERLDAALRELLDVRAAEIGAAAQPAEAVSAQLADQLGVTIPTRRRSWRRAWRNSFMSNTLKFAMAGATALVVAVVLGLYFSQPGGLIGPPVATPSPDPTPTAAPPQPPTAEPTPEAATPVEIAEAYIGARNAYDSERARELVADGFWTTEPDEGFRDLDSLELAFEKHKAFGFHYSDGDCRERSASPDEAVVECNYLWTTEPHRIRDYPPTPARFTFRITDGRISSVLHDASYDFYFGPGSFSQFLSGHREYRDRLDDTHVLEPEEAREVLDLLPEYFQLYEEWLNRPEPTPAASPLEGIGAFESGLHAMSTPREAHTATLLSDGRVLFTGGSAEGWESFLNSAETYDHSTGEFTATGSMTDPRGQHTATLLADGRVLVAGGSTIDYWTFTASAEIFDPQNETFVPSGSMDSARKDHTATLLADGRVLIVGGRTTDVYATASAETYNPDSGTFVLTDPTTVRRVSHTATLLADGRVLIVGGRREASAELYDPASGTFAATGSMAGLRSHHTATLLTDGRVLIVGGCSIDHPAACADFPDGLATAEIYDPASGTFASTGPMVVGRQDHTATLLADGGVLVSGGVDEYWNNESTGPLRLTAEIWNPDSGTFVLAGWMEAARVFHTSTLLPDGRVLLAGGRFLSGEDMEILESVELYRQ